METKKEAVITKVDYSCPECGNAVVYQDYWDTAVSENFIHICPICGKKDIALSKRYPYLEIDGHSVLLTKI